MRKHLFQWMLLLVAFVVPWVTHAQVTYTCDFESGADGWEFSNASGCGWYVGSATGGNNGGSNGLYVSTDGGETFNSYPTNQVVHAYRSFAISAGTTVSISYDWKCQGESTWDFMRVYLLPASAALPTGYSSSTSLPSGAISLDGGHLNGSTSWQTKTRSDVPITNGGVYNLVFAFKSDGSTQNGAPAVDNITFTYMEPSCVAPMLSVVPSATAAAFNWIASQTATSYEWLYTAGSDPDWAAASSTTNCSVSVEGLNPNTSYVAYVRSRCSDTDVSDPVSVPFRTLCGAITVTADAPFTCGFEDNGDLSCWDVLNGNITISSSNQHSGTKYLHFTGATGNAIALPEFVDGGSTGLQLTVWTRPESYSSSSCGTFTIGYMTDITDAESYVEINSWAYNTFSGYEKKEIVLPSMPAGARIVMKQINNASNWYWYVDDIEVSVMPSCVKPTALTFSQIDSTSATIAWIPGHVEDNTWEVEYRSEAGAWTSSEAINSNPYQLITLEANTNYWVRVRTICDASADDGISMWSDSVMFRTECGSAYVGSDAPFVQDFNGLNMFPECWNNSEGTGSERWSLSFSDGRTGGCMEIYNSTSGNYNILKTQTLELSVPSRLKFWHKYNGTGVFTVQASTDGGATRNDLLVVANSADWTQHTIDLSGYTGSKVKLYFKFEMTAGYDDCYLDDVVVEAIPSCLEVSNLQVVAATASDVTLSWVDNNANTPASWTVAYGPTATFDLDDENSYSTLNVYDVEAVIPNLNEYTSYSFAVRTNCSGSDMSVWSPVVSIITAPDCGSQSPRLFVLGNESSTSTGYYPFYFSSYSTYVCGGSYLSFMPDELAANDLYAGNIRGISLNSASSYDVTMPIRVYARLQEDGMVYSSGSDASDTNDMTLVYAGSYTFKKGWNDIVFNTPFAYDGTSGIELYFQRDSSIAQTPQFYYTSKGSYSDGYYVVYTYSTSYTGSLNQYATDYRPNVRFTMCVSEPSCLAPLSFAKKDITTSSVTLSWLNRSGAAAWNLMVGTENIEIFADEVEMNDDTVTYTLSGLEPNTSYTVKLRSVCGDEDMSDWTQELDIHTPCLPIVVDVNNPFEEGFENDFAFNCWTNEHVSGPGTYLWATNTSYPHSGSHSMGISDQSATTITNLTLPPMQLDASAVNGYKFSFWMYRADNYDTKLQEGVRVLINTNPSTEGATELMYIHRNRTLGDLTESAAGVYPYSTTIPAEYYGSVVYIILQGFNEYGGASYVDDIVVSANPNCMPLTAFDTVGAPDVDQVTLTWKEYDSDRPMQYLVEYTATSVANALPEVVSVAYSADMETGEANTLNYTLEGLTHNTAYRVRVAAVCTVGDTSEWSSAITFRTGCGAFELPYTMGFELADVNSETTLPYCWTRYNSADASYPAVYNGSAFDGSRSLRYSVSAGGATAEVAILPQIVDVATTASRVVFYAKAGSALDSALTIGIMTDPNDYTTFTEVAHINATTTYAKHKINLPQTVGYVAIRGNRPVSGSSTIYLYVDNVMVEQQPECELPEGFAFRNGSATSNSAQLTWIDAEGSAWEIERTYTPADGEPLVETVNVAAANITRGTVNTDSVYYTLTGLNARTQYSLRLRTVCGTENSAWADATVSFTTKNNETAITAINLVGQVAADINAENHTVTVTMPFGTDLTAVRGNFAMSQGATADTNGTAFPTTISTMDFSSPLTITVKAQDNAFTQIWTITVVNETCASPASLAVSNIGKYGFDLMVTPNALSENANFQLVCSTEELDAAALEASEKVNFEYDSENPYSVTHLFRNTTYYIYVRGNCGDDDFSNWVSTTVTTLDLTVCQQVGNSTSTGSIYHFPYSQYYHNSYTQQLYTADEIGLTGDISAVSFNYIGSTPTTRNITVYMGTTDETSLSSGWITPANMTQVFAAQDVTFSNDGTGWFQLPLNNPFSYTGGNVVVAMYMNYSSSETAYAGQYNFYNQSISGKSRYQTNDDATPDQITLVNGVSTGSGSTSTYRNNIKFCFHSELCLAPVANEVELTGTGTNTAMGSWQIVGGEFPNTYDVRVVEAGTTNMDDAIFSLDDIAADQTFVNITGLAPYTEYDFYVRVRCNADGYDDGYSEWSEKKTFRTNSNCRPVDASTLQAVAVSKTSATFSWVNGSNEYGIPMQDNNFQYCLRTTTLSEIENEDVDASGIVGDNSNGTAEVTINSLEPGSTYYFYVANSCSDGTTSPYTLVTIEMPAPCVIPTNIEATEVGKYNATLTWTGDAYEEGVSYELYYATEEVEDLDILIGNVDNISTNEATLTMLQRNTTYYVYVRSSCPTYGASNWSEAYSFTTLDMGFDCTGEGNVVTVADATNSNDYFPVYGLYMDANNHTQSIYPANLLTNLQGKMIKTMKYFVKSGSSSNWSNQQITVKLMETTATSVSSSFVSVSDATVIYTGTLTASIANGMVVTLDEPFTYNGGNLLVDFSSISNGSYSSCSFYGKNNAGSSRNDYGGSIYTSTFLPKIEFGVCSTILPCPVMEQPTVENVTNNSATINWAASTGDHVASYELIVSTEAVNDFESAPIIDGIEDTIFVAEGLEPNTDYYVYVRTNCNVDPYEDGWSTWSPALIFRTESNCFRPSGLAVESVTSNSVTLVWHRGNADVTAWDLAIDTTGSLQLSVEDAGVEIFGANDDSVRYTFTQYALPDSTANLMPNTDYQVRVMSNCTGQDNGFSDYTEAVSFHTLRADAAITAFSVDQLFPDGVQMAATEIDDANSTINITVLGGTDLSTLPQYFTTSDYVSLVKANGDTVMYGDIVDFSEPVTYTVYAQDANVSRDWTVTVVAETCATAYGLTAQVNRVSADLSWNIGDVTVQNFDLVVSETAVEDFTTVTPQTINVAGTETSRSYTLTGLERGTEYYVYLKNPCTEDWAMAQAINFTTGDLEYCQQVGNGTSTNYGPICGYYGYERNAYIYTPEDGLNAGTITKLQWNYSSGSGNVIPAKIYLKNITETAFGDVSDLVWNDMIADATMVYDASFTVVSGWNEIDITDFEYTGGNLMVLVASNKTGTGGATANAYYTATGSNNHAFGRKDSSMDDDASFSSFSQNGVNNSRHNIQFCLFAEGCADIAEAAIENVGTETATLTWTASESDYLQNYEIVLSETELNEAALATVSPSFTAAAEATSYDFSNLVSYTNYYVYIRANCMLDDEHNDGNSNWKAVPFRTNSLCRTADNLVATLTDRNAAHITWTNADNSAVQYVLSSVALDDAALASVTVVDLAATDSLDLTGLEFATNYFLYVRHNCGEGVVSPWLSVGFTTRVECPWVVDATVEPFFNAANIDWTDGEFSPATTWRLVLTAIEGGAEVFNQVVDRHPYTVLGLTAETAYNVSISAVCGGSESEAYSELDFTTPATPGDCETVAEGTETTTYVPVYGLYMDDPQGTQSIYPASMLTNLAGQEILSLHYHVTDPGSGSIGSGKTMKVWMTEVDASDLSDGFQSIANATLVYDGTVSQSDFSVANGFTVTLDEPYIYNGGNLLIAFQSNQEDVSGYTTITFAAMSANSGSRYGYGIDNYNFSGSGTNVDYLPTVDFCVTPSGCHAVRYLASANVTSNSADVSWLPGGSETQWNMVVSDSELDADALAVAQYSTETTVNHTLTDLNVDADYYVYVRPICDAATSSYGDWRMVHFTTIPSCSAPATAVAEVNEDGSVTFTVTSGEYGEPESYAYEYWTVSDESNVVSGTSSTTEWTLTDLPTGEVIHWHVRANCGDSDNSRWTDGNDIFICGTIVVTEANPYVEDFKTSSRVNCWATTSDGDGRWGLVQESDGTIWVKNTAYYGDFTLTSPAIQLPAEGRAILSFREYIDYASDYGENTIYVMPEGSTLDEATVVWNPEEVENGEATQILNLNNFLSQTFRLVFRYQGSNAHDWALTDITVAIDPAYTVTATVATTADERGSATADADLKTEDGRFYNSVGADLTATANDGYFFTHWTNANGDTLSTNAEWTINPTQDTTVYANFDTASYTLAAFVASIDAVAGSVTIDGQSPATGSNRIEVSAKYMTQHTVSAIATGNYVFDHWSDLNAGDADYSNATRTITMPNHDVAYRALFSYNADIIDSVLTETVCDKYVLRRSDNTIVQNYTTSGTKQITYDDPEMGIIRLTLNLTVNHNSNQGFYVSTCGAYTWSRTIGGAVAYSETYTVAQDGVTASYTSAEGCPSVDTLYLTFLAPSEEWVEPQTACDSYRYTFSDGSLSEEVFTESSDNATVHTTTPEGCDSLIHFVLTVNKGTSSTTTQTACDEYTWTVNSVTYTYENDGNTVDDTVFSTNAAGCPDSAILQLTIISSSSVVGTSETMVVCDSVLWKDEYRTATDTYLYQYTVEGSACLGTDTLYLTVKPSAHTDTAAIACDVFTWHGTQYTASTTTPTYTMTNGAANGCDSIVTLNLTVNNTATGVETVAACETYTWNGVVYTVSTTTPTNTITAGAANGCDSIVTLHLTINHASSGVETVEACETYTWNGQVYTASTTTPTDTLIGADVNGCDSIVTLHLTINHASSGVETVTACDSYTWNGVVYTASTSTPTDTLIGADVNGCDSIVTLHLTINTSTTGEDEMTACDSYTWRGVVYTESTSYNDTLTAANGCDSVVTVSLTILYSTTGSFDSTVCDSYTWNGVTYTESGVYNDTLQAANSCDSVVTLTLVVNHGERSHEYVTNCGSYTWEIDGQTYTQSTEAFYSSTNEEGCPVLDTLTLTILSAYNTNLDETVCDSYTWYGTTYTESAVLTHTLEASNGCDSVLTLNLTVNYSTEEDVTLVVEPTELPYIFEGQTFETYGEYDVVIVNAANCDSTIHLTLSENDGIETADVLSLLKVYPNPTTGRVELSAEIIEKVEVLDLVGRCVAVFENTNKFDLTNLAAGTYTLRITMPEGMTLRKVVKR